MLRGATRLHPLVQWNWPQKASNVALPKRVPYAVNSKIRCNRLSNEVFQPLTEFRGIYSGIDIVPDETFKLLWNRIEAVHRVRKPVEVVKEWKGEGNQLTEELMFSVTFKLCARTWFKEAVRFTNWLREEGNEPCSEAYKMLRLDMLSRVGSVKAHAHPFFNELVNKTETGYLLLLRGYTAESAIDDAEKLMEEFKQSRLMTTGRAYTLMMKMYIRKNNSDKAVKTFEEFEASGLPHDSEMYLELVTNKVGVFGSIPVVEKTEDALQKMTRDRINRRDMLKIYGLLGKAEEVDRLWTEIKMSRNVIFSETLAAILAYDLLGDISEAEEVSRELEDRMQGVHLSDHCLAMLRMYARHGDMDKAFLWREKMEHSGNPGDFEQAHPLVMAYLDKGDFDEALETFNRYVAKGKGLLHPRLLVEECMVKLLEGFSKRQDAAGAEALLEKVPKMNTVRVYHSLIKVYLSSNKVPQTSIKKRMVYRHLPTESGETKELLERLGDETSNDDPEKTKKKSFFAGKRKFRKAFFENIQAKNAAAVQKKTSSLV